jgi:hypothetical protein
MKLTLTIAIVIAACFTNLASLTVTRSDWHFCNKCHVMFYSEGSSGVCAAGGTHQAQGFEFQLPFNGEETKTTQTNWRLCRKCHALFYFGFPNKGRCPAGGAHAADSKYPYSLPHDVPETARAQPAWRFCNKCNAMFYDGFPDKGHCAAGGAHVAQGFNFVLPHGSAVTEAPAPSPDNTPKPIRHLGKRPLPPTQTGNESADVCASGYVWREAQPTDHVCVSPESRAVVREENGRAPQRWTAGAFGPHTCTQGYVWREAFQGDDVCVTPQRRDQVREENSVANSRRASQ